MPYADIEMEKAFRKRQRATPASKEYHKRYSAEYFQANKEKFRKWSHDYKLRNPARFILLVAKQRAKKRGIAFEIDESDVIIPDVCPVLGIPLFFKVKTRKNDVTPNSPSLDRIHPKKGYVKGNVQVISWRANNIKRDATPEELRLVADFVSRQKDR